MKFDWLIAGYWLANSVLLTNGYWLKVIDYPKLMAKSQRPVRKPSWTRRTKEIPSYSILLSHEEPKVEACTKHKRSNYPECVTIISKVTSIQEYVLVYDFLTTLRIWGLWSFLLKMFRDFSSTLSFSQNWPLLLWYYEHNNWTGTMLPLSSSGQIMALFILDCVCEQVREIRLSVNI